MKDQHFFQSINTPMKIVFFMWLVFFIEESVLGYKLSNYGIYPRTFEGLIGIMSATFLHGDIFHLLSNTFPILILGVSLYFFYPHWAPKVMAMGYILTNFLIWAFARPYIHLGASGLVYTLASFLIFIAFFKRSFLSLIVASVTLFFYGSMVYGIFPGKASISWEAHLIGAAVGFFAAMRFGRKRNWR